MARNRADAADVELAKSLVEGAVKSISDGYHELVTRLRSDSEIADLVADEVPEITGTARLSKRALPTQRLFAKVLSSDFIAGYTKTNKELVSRGEKEAGALIRLRLTAERPDDGYKGEETGTVDGRTGRWWLDDPVDGTAAMLKTAIVEALELNYPEPLPTFAITVGLVEDGVATIGVVAELRPLYDNHVPSGQLSPEREPGLQVAKTFVGYKTERGYVTTINQTEAITLQVDTARSTAAVMTTSPEVMFHDANGRRDYVKEGGFEALLAGMGQRRPIVDGNIIRILQTSDGCSVAYERDLTAEDIAAAGPILAGLGVNVTDQQGSALEFGDLTKEYVALAGTEALVGRAVELISGGERSASESLRSKGELPSHPYFDSLFTHSPSTGYAQKFTGTDSY